MNEVSFHMLEATAVHLYFTRGPPGQAGGAMANGAGGDQQQGAAGGNYGDSNLASLSQIAKKVYQFLRSVQQSNEGVNQGEIGTALKMNLGDVAKAGDELLSNGFIYTTVDDNTWAILDAA